MKIGILTFWWSEDNYGQQLQCFALQEYLRNAGHEPFLIRYNKQQDFPESSFLIKCVKGLNPIKLYKFCKGKINEEKIRREYATHNRDFKGFQEKYITATYSIYTSYEDLKKSVPFADAYIVGSDQVWNFKDYHPRGFHSILKAYMLDFVPKDKKRMSYAASWGIKSVDESLKTEIAELLGKFAYVSVREESGVVICNDLGIRADCVADPTLLLSADSYRKIYTDSSVRKPNGKFLLLYMLNNLQKGDINAAVFEFAKQQNLSVVYVTGNGVIDKYEKFYATIPEWLYLVDNAEYVVTNSFHCCVFSLIFNKRFGAVKLNGRFSGMNTRLDSLFAKYTPEERYIENNDFSALDIPIKPIEKAEAYELLNKLHE